jgi:hypothetical protein
LKEEEHMGSASCLPLLPGYVAQPVVGFHDPTGRFAYELNLVYSPAEEIRPGIMAGVLQRGLSYWSVTWPSGGGGAHESVLGRWVNFNRARKLRPGQRLSFQRFCSLGEMRDIVPEMLRMNDPTDGTEPEPIPLDLTLKESTT